MRPHSAAVRGVDGIAGHRQFEGPLAPDVAADGDERRVAEEAALAAGQLERGLLRGDGEIARGDELASGRSGAAREPWRKPAGGSPGPCPSSPCTSRTGVAPSTARRQPCPRSCARRRTPDRFPRGPRRARRSRLRRANAFVSSSITSSARALRFSGRFRVIVMMSPCCSLRMCWYVMRTFCRPRHHLRTLRGFRHCDVGFREQIGKSDMAGLPTAA